jgi:hypothetical protein
MNFIWNSYEIHQSRLSRCKAHYSKACSRIPTSNPWTWVSVGGGWHPRGWHDIQEDDIQEAVVGSESEEDINESNTANNSKDIMYPEEIITYTRRPRVKEPNNTESGSLQENLEEEAPSEEEDVVDIEEFPVVEM